MKLKLKNILSNHIYYNLRILTNGMHKRYLKLDVVLAQQQSILLEMELFIRVLNYQMNP